MLTRREVVSHLHRDLEALPFVNAAWITGSDSFGAADDRSDVDLCLDVADGSSDRAFEALEASLERLSPIVARWHVPEPAWHGHRQRFYRLADAPETLLVDVALKERSTVAQRFDERETHGEPHVLFDRLGIVHARPLDVAANDARIRERLDQLESRAALFTCFAAKEAARGRALDALWAWQAFVIAPLVEALRIVHCPERFSFGMRYLHRDLPPPLAARLQDLAYVRDLADLRTKEPGARAWLGEALAQARQRHPREAEAQGG